MQIHGDALYAFEFMIVSLRGGETLGFSVTIGKIWLQSGTESRLIYIDPGANAHGSSVVLFRHRYPDVHDFETTVV
jgi:hypothetical protein